MDLDPGLELILAVRQEAAGFGGRVASNMDRSPPRCRGVKWAGIGGAEMSQRAACRMIGAFRAVRGGDRPVPAGRNKHACVSRTNGSRHRSIYERASNT